MELFSNESVNLNILRKRAYNMRWAEVPADVIPLTAADSDFPVAPEIIEAICDYTQAGYFSYTPKLGFPEFRRSIANSLKIRKNEEVPEDLILPIDSAARAMSVIAKAFLEPGDEAIVFDPVDFLFKTSMEAAGAKIVLFPMKIKDGRIDFSELEQYITPKTKMLGLCNPHNPLGMVYPMEELAYLAELSNKYGFYIMNDEIWSDIVFSDAKFNSIVSLGADMNQRTLSVYGFSKSFGIAGLRSGCIYCQSPSLFDKIIETSEVMSTIGGISSLSQIAGMVALDKCYYWVGEFIARMQQNRDYALERLEKMPFITCRKSAATFVLFPDVSACGMKPEELTAFLLEKHKVSLVPGGASFFGPGSDGHVRICLATSHSILKEGLDRLERGLCELANK